jgi:hypothetical protein
MFVGACSDLFVFIYFGYPSASTVSTKHIAGPCAAFLNKLKETNFEKGDTQIFRYALVSLLPKI